MNVIIAYLDTMFSTYPQTPRMLEAKAELQGMMEDAYANLIQQGRSENEAIGQVIRDFGNLDEVAPVLGISADIDPQWGTSNGPVHPDSSKVDSPHEPITMEEAKGYATVVQGNRFPAVVAVALLVLSPAALVSLPTAAESGVLPLAPTAAAFIGLLVLLVLVALGVILMVAVSRSTAPYKRIIEGRFSPNPEVTLWVDELSQQYERGRIRALQIAIALWLLAPIPLLGFSMLLDDSPHDEFWTVVGVVIVLAIAAAGLAVLLPQNWAHGVAEKVSRRAFGGDDMTTAKDEGEDSIVGVIAAFYFPLLLVIFLAWSFIGDAWGISWIVWPIGGALFGAIAGGLGAVEGYRKSLRH
ncbi:MAG: permease prefix domain 1-containing protein [Propioniciclava sp.]